MTVIVCHGFHSIYLFSLKFETFSYCVPRQSVIYYQGRGRQPVCRCGLF